MGILEKISEIEKEIARTQKNKATEYHLGLLKAKLAKYRAQLLEPSKSASSKGEGFDVMKSGDARVALIGFPSVGKSTFLSLMTSTASEAASYEFTTLTCIPGVIEYKGANIQLLDLPGIIEGAAQGKGRGRQVIAVARTADVVIMMLDATKGEVQRSLLEKELESVGIRLNKHKPNIYFKPKKGGGISFNSTVTLTQCSEKLVQLILHEYKIFNAEVLFREDCSPDEFIDVIVGNRVYMPCLYVYNKIDQISMEEVDRLARKPNSVVISCGMKLNLDYLLEMLWEYLALTCIYTKKRGQRPDFTDAIILRKGASVEHVTRISHLSICVKEVFLQAWCWPPPSGLWAEALGLPPGPGRPVGMWEEESHCTIAESPPHRPPLCHRQRDNQRSTLSGQLLDASSRVSFQFHVTSGTPGTFIPTKGIRCPGSWG
ncbi:developmentally-regulated GTP-binding protein 2 isoform X1 [Macaca nemestrina]|uniref:developmentally-regulated GTP-binding protein 2 isoform X1 n=2 Tax=Macaca nemestrina TaxID=9545 RepID=UPI0039B89B74